jgi:hypothetical protein
MRDSASTLTITLAIKSFLGHEWHSEVFKNRQFTRSSRGNCSVVVTAPFLPQLHTKRGDGPHPCLRLPRTATRAQIDKQIGS